MSKDKSMIAVGIYNSSIQKRGMNPQEAFEGLIMRLHSMGVDLKEVQMILGMNSSKMVDFNKGWIGQVPSLYQGLDKEPLSNSQITSIKKILSILHLRNLQQIEWTKENNYISFKRLELSAEDYNQSNIPTLLITYFEKYMGEDYKEYVSEIETLYAELLQSKPTIEELRDVARKEGFQEVYVESPGRLTNVPKEQQSFAGNAPLKKGGVIRFAPTPNGPLHLGHGRGISILSDYADKYDMEFILRFDDTDCSTKGSNLPTELNIPNVYNHIISDFTWIRGEAPDKIVYASDRENLDRYIEYGRGLIKNSFAYVYFDMGDKKYIYGNSVDENLNMYDALINAGDNPQFTDAGVLLGIPSDMKTLNRFYNMGGEEIVNEIRRWVELNVYAQKLKPSNIFGYSNTESGTKIMRYQKNQNIRVQDRGEKQWLWPTLNLQSVVDDKEEGVTHVIRGLDYDYPKAVKSNDVVVLRTIRFQTIMRELIKAPPVASTQNWGNVSWDGDYTLSTSKLRKMIMDGEFDERGFLHPSLPTIYALRSDGDNWGASFKFYWTRFNLPNALDPQFKVDSYNALNNELKSTYTNERDLINKNNQIIKNITKLEDKGLYLAEEK
tara:strand:- start:795 stop:2621 length:1827 start_codon:yes stop_codon:yes gene_type:complete